jgi:hypothetical protein
MIIENRLMWSPANDRWRLNDEPRGPLDNLIHTLHTCSAVEIFVHPYTFMKERPPIRFYDATAKDAIRHKHVRPILQAAFAPRGSRSLPDKPWEVDKKGNLIFVWDELEEFFVNLIWCSKLRAAFVFDLDRLLRASTNIRNDLVRDRVLADPRMLNDLIAIMSLFRHREVWCLVPSESSRGNAIQIWRQLHAQALYKRLSHETRRLGLQRLTTIDVHLSALGILARRIAENKAVAQLASLAKSGVSLFLGPEGRFVSETASRLGSIVFGKRYVPPIYSLTDIERSFDKMYYPHLLKGDDT